MLILAAGCSTTPNYDQHFGEAVRQARTEMTLNPDAGKTADPVLGVDGMAAHQAITRYENSFKEPPPVIGVINIGGAIGGNGSGAK
jgi:hypothetical protein